MKNIHKTDQTGLSNHPSIEEKPVIKIQILNKQKYQCTIKRYQGVVIINQVLSKKISNYQGAFIKKIIKKREVLNIAIKNLTKIFKNLLLTKKRMSFLKIANQKKSWNLHLKACKLIDIISKKVLNNNKKIGFSKIQKIYYSQTINNLKQIQKYAIDNKFPAKLMQQLKKSTRINPKNQKSFVQNLQINILPSLADDQNITESRSRKSTKSDSQLLIESYKASINFISELSIKLQQQKQKNQQNLVKLKKEKQNAVMLEEIKNIQKKLNGLYDLFKQEQNQSKKNIAKTSMKKYIDQQIILNQRKQENPIALRIIKSLLDENIKNKTNSMQIAKQTQKIEHKKINEQSLDQKLLCSLLMKYQIYFCASEQQQKKGFQSTKDKVEHLERLIDKLLTEHKQVKTQQGVENQKVIQQQQKAILHFQNTIKKQKNKNDLSPQAGLKGITNKKVQFLDINMNKKSQVQQIQKQKQKQVNKQLISLSQLKQETRKIASSNKKRGKTIEKIKEQYARFSKEIGKTKAQELQRRKSLSLLMQKPKFYDQNNSDHSFEKQSIINNNVIGQKSASQAAKMVYDIITKVTNSLQQTQQSQIFNQLSEISKTPFHQDVFHRMQSFAVLYILQNLDKQRKRNKTIQIQSVKKPQEAKLAHFLQHKIHKTEKLVRTPHRNERSREVQKTIKK